MSITTSNAPWGNAGQSGLLQTADRDKFVSLFSDARGRDTAIALDMTDLLDGRRQLSKGRHLAFVANPTQPTVFWRSEYFPDEESVTVSFVWDIFEKDCSRFNVQKDSADCPSRDDWERVTLELMPRCLQLADKVPLHEAPGGDMVDYKPTEELVKTAQAIFDTVTRSSNSEPSEDTQVAGGDESRETASAKCVWL